MNAHYRLKFLTGLTLLFLIPGCAGGRTAYNRGLLAEVTQNYEAAMSEYKTALENAPGNTEYRLKYEQARFAAALDHFEKGRRALDSGNLDTAKTKFTRTLEIDATHELARQELAKVNATLQARAQNTPEPVIDFEQLREANRVDPAFQSQLEPTVSGPIDIRMNQDSRVAFETLAELAGLNVIFDPDFRGATIPIELTNVNIYEALDILALQTRTFWMPINKTTILVSPDNQTKRRDYEQHILKTIYLTNSVSATEITEAITALRTLLNMRFIAQSTTMNAIIVRDTADRIAIAEKIIEDIDKSKPEVVVEVTVLEVDRNTLRDLGILPPAGTNFTFANPGAAAPAAGQSASNSIGLRDLDAINSGNFTTNIPPAVASFLATSSTTRLVQNPRVRATDGKLAQIRIGSRVPVPSGSFQPAFVGATGTPVIQFQYVDIGVNLDITPKVLLNREVSMTVLVQVQALAGDRNAGGVSLPVFTNRSIQHEIRLTEGETNVLGGIITDTEAVSITGIPGLKDLPILRHLFSQERKTRDETEIIIMLTPHIVRMPNISAINLRGLNIGTEVNTRLRTAQPEAAVQPAPAAQTAAPAAAAQAVPSAPATATLTFLPSSAVLGPAPTVIKLGIEGSNVSSVDVTLAFDPASLGISEITDGGFLSRDGQVVAVVQRIDSDNGTITVSIERPPGAPPISGAGNLLSITVRPGSRKGESVLRVTEVRVRDGRQVSQAGGTTEVRVSVP